MSSVRCTVDRAGVEISASVVDQGAGSYTLLRRLAAETLAVPLEFVRVRAAAVGSDDALQDAGAGASRVTAVAGRAVIESYRAAAEIGGLPAEITTSRYRPAVRLSALGRELVAAEGSAAASWPAPPDVDVRSHGGVAVELSKQLFAGGAVPTEIRHEDGRWGSAFLGCRRVIEGNPSRRDEDPAWRLASEHDLTFHVQGGGLSGP